MVTYSDLFQFVIMLCAVITLVIYTCSIALFWPGAFNCSKRWFTFIALSSKSSICVKLWSRLGFTYLLKIAYLQIKFQGYNYI